jgi:hypothetical protein
VADDRQESSTAAMPPATNAMVSASVRSSIASAPSMTDVLTPHCHTPSPAVAPSVTRASAAVRCRRANRPRSSPTSSTMQAPAASATSGESASQSIFGACGVIAPSPPP